MPADENVRVIVPDVVDVVVDVQQSEDAVGASEAVERIQYAVTSCPLVHLAVRVALFPIVVWLVLVDNVGALGFAALISPKSLLEASDISP